MKVKQLMKLLEEIPGDRDVTMFLEDSDYDIEQIELYTTKKFDEINEIEVSEIVRIAVVF